MTALPSSEPEIESRSSTIARAPFDIDTADVIIRTSDHVDFYVFKNILSLASPFFHDMFSLIQPPSDRTGQDPVVVSEDSNTMDCLFRLCYPVDDPVIQDLTSLDRILQAVIKYQMTEATKLVTKSLLSFLDSCPLHVFAISCRLELEEEAKKAAHAWYQKRYWKHKKSSKGECSFESTLAGASYMSEMSDISSGAYFRLIQYCGSRSTSPPSTFCTAPRPTLQTPTIIPEPLPTIELYSQEADLILRSSDGVEFPVHTLFLRAASAVRLLQLPSTTHPASHLPLIEAHMSTRVLTNFLRFCYPLQSRGEATDDLPTAHALLRTAKEYEMSKIIAALRERMLHNFAKTEPMSVYCISVKEGWLDVAEEAARHTVGKDIEDLYYPWMESLPAVSYYRLLKYHHEYRSAVIKIVKRHAPETRHWKNLLNQESLALPTSQPLPARSTLPVMESVLRAVTKVSPQADLSPQVATILKDSKAMEEDIVQELSAIHLLREEALTTVLDGAPSDAV